MSDKDLPAFPSDYVKHKRMAVGNEVPIVESSSGMTLRDYFAAKAMMQGIARAFIPQDKRHEAQMQIAIFSYEMADAMLEARKA